MTKWFMSLCSVHWIWGVFDEYLLLSQAFFFFFGRTCANKCLSCLEGRTSSCFFFGGLQILGIHWSKICKTCGGGKGGRICKFIGLICADLVFCEGRSLVSNEQRVKIISNGMLVQSPVSFVLQGVGIITQTTVLGHLRSVSKGSVKKKIIISKTFSMYFYKIS